MSERTCEIDGKIFDGVPCADDAVRPCAGCAGHGNADVCVKLADCTQPRIIWVVKQ